MQRYSVLWYIQIFWRCIFVNIVILPLNSENTPLKTGLFSLFLHNECKNSIFTIAKMENEMTERISYMTIRVIIVVTFLVATIDTYLYVYPSLSRSLLMEICITLMAFVVLVHSIVSKTFFITRFDILVLSWIGYVVMHTTIVQPHEMYRTNYICISLLFVILLSIELNRIIKRRNVENVLLLVAIIHLIFMFGQLIGLVESGNDYFSITGSNESPSVTAIYLTSCVPLIFSRIKFDKNKGGYIMMFVATLFAITSLRCRTAYLGLFAEFVVYAVLNWKKSHLKNSITFRKVSVVLIFSLVLFGLLGLKLYQMKKDSADGRLLIWKLSASMIADRPTGYGYGLFEKHYNLRQAEYFKQCNYSNTEKRNANFVNMAYNDYLEHGVEGGVIGMVLLLWFYFALIHKTIKNNYPEDAAVVIAFAVMSLTNFVYSSIQPWLLLMCYAAFCNSSDRKKRNEAGKMLCKATAYALFICNIVFFFLIGTIAKAQRQLKIIEDARKEYGKVDDKRYAEIEPYISTSEAFWKSRALNYMAMNEFPKAIRAIHTAREYSSSPELLYSEYVCQRELNNVDSAVKILSTMSCMLPRDLALKCMLMDIHVLRGNKSQAIRYADEILYTDIKYRTTETEKILKRALKVKGKQ